MLSVTAPIVTFQVVVTNNDEDSIDCPVCLSQHGQWGGDNPMFSAPDDTAPVLLMLTPFSLLKHR